MVFEILDRDLLSIKHKFWKAETELKLDVFLEISLRTGIIRPVYYE